MRKTQTALLIVVLAAVATSAFAQQKPPARSIVNVTGQLYRAQNDNHYTVFLVTPDGIIMSDPINRDFARYLKAEFATRFKQPVRYILYTHKDWDHASGGVVFADTATFVGHANMRAGVALPGGTINMRIPAGAQTGKQLRVRGKGLASDPPGDLYIDIRIVAPPADTPEAKKLYETMAREFAFDPRREPAP